MGVLQQRDSSVLGSAIRSDYFHTSTNQCTRSKLRAFDQLLLSVVRRDWSNNNFHTSNFRLSAYVGLIANRCVQNLEGLQFLVMRPIAPRCLCLCTSCWLHCLASLQTRLSQMTQRAPCVYTVAVSNVCLRRVQPQIYRAASIVGRLIARRRPEKKDQLTS